MICAVALLGLKETARTPLLGAFPTVEDEKEAAALVAGQEENPHLDLNTMPLQEEYLRIAVDAAGEPVDGVEPVRVTELSDVDRALLVSTRTLPTDEDPEQGPGEHGSTQAQGTTQEQQGEPPSARW